ncbi:peptidase family C50-domain-containing protein [Lipomyces japonicus]|uniref:peptidase family C50-domain-containing protein n=1 Tax=Lipomyces japonicus TaxID=56871 RepID=UPI0034CE04B4
MVTNIETKKTEVLLPSENGLKLNKCHRALNHIAYTINELQSKGSLPDCNDILPRILLDSKISDRELEKLIADVDLLRRLTFKVHGTKSLEFIISLPQVFIYYKQNSSMPIFRKVSCRLIENIMALIKNIISDVTNSSLSQCLSQCYELAVLINDKKCCIYVANTFYNYGINLWRCKFKDEAVAAWQDSVTLHRQNKDETSITSFVKKLERLSLALIDMGKSKQAEHLLSEAVAELITFNEPELRKSFKILSIHKIIKKFDDLNHILKLLVNLKIPNPSRFSNIHQDLELNGLVLEWELKLLISSKKLPPAEDIFKLYQSLEIIYEERHPVKLAEVYLMCCLAIINSGNYDLSLEKMSSIYNSLETHIFGDDIGHTKYIKDISASFALYMSIVKHQQGQYDSHLLNKAVALWLELMESGEIDENCIERSFFLSNIELLNDFLELLGGTQSQVNILNSFQKLLQGVDEDLLTRQKFRLASSYMNLGYSGTASELLRSFQVFSTSRKFDDILEFRSLEIELFISSGNLENAKESALAIKKYVVEYDEVSITISDVNAQASVCRALSALLLAFGQPKQSLEYSKASVKLLNRIIANISGGLNMLRATAPKSWRFMINLIRSYYQVSATYDHIGMVRESEFYYSEVVRLCHLVKSPGLTAYYNILVSDFYIRSGNITKSFSIINDLLSSDFTENPVYLALLEFTLGKYYKEIGETEEERARYNLAESKIISLINSAGSHITDIESMLSNLSLIPKRRSTRSGVKQTSQHFYLDGLRGEALRSRSYYHLMQEEWEEANALLQESASLGFYHKHKLQQNLAESRHQFLNAMSILQSDPVFGVLQESALSIPSVIRSANKATKENEGLTKPQSSNTGRLNRKKTTKNGIVEVENLLSKSRATILETFFWSSNACSSSEKYLLSNRLGEILLLQSAVGSSSKEDGHTLAANYFYEMSKGQTLVKDVSSKEESLLYDYESSLHLRSRENLVDLNSFQKEYIDIIPDRWAVVSISLCDDTDDMIISRFQAGESSFLLRLPLNRHSSRDADEDIFSYKSALEEIRAIIASSNDTAQASRTMQNATKSQKQDWWASRRALDSRLKELLDNIEYCWLGGFKGILTGNVRNRDLLSKFSTSFLKILKKHLPSRRILRTRRSEASATKKKTDEVKIDPRVLELFMGLSNLDESDNSEMLEDLIYFILDILQFNGECNAYDELDMDQIIIELQEILRAYRDSIEDLDESVEHLVLILDKSSHMIPWESLPCLRGKSVSRVPSLTCLHQIFKNRDNRPLNVSNGAYILNPSSDLMNTQSQFEPRLASFHNWESIIGRSPTEDEFKRVLETKDIVLYFGHGGGEQYVRTNQIKNLQHCSATFLLGCSSGELHSSGEFEPWGTPINYLIGGCQMLVANLWDVTDKDIDRFSDAMLSSWGLYDSFSADLAENQKRCNIGQSLSSAREVCNLKYLNGAAPVLYGIPLMV